MKQEEWLTLLPCRWSHSSPLAEDYRRMYFCKEQLDEDSILDQIWRPVSQGSTIARTKGD